MEEGQGVRDNKKERDRLVSLFSYRIFPVYLSATNGSRAGAVKIIRKIKADRR